MCCLLMSFSTQRNGENKNLATIKQILILVFLCEKNQHLSLQNSCYIHPFNQQEKAKKQQLLFSPFTPLISSSSVNILLSKLSLCMCVCVCMLTFWEIFKHVCDNHHGLILWLFKNGLNIWKSGKTMNSSVWLFSELRTPFWAWKYAECLNIFTFFWSCDCPWDLFVKTIAYLGRIITSFYLKKNVE